MDSKCIIDQSL